MITQIVDGIPFELASSFDFSFLKEYGRVFKVFDNQNSGNICFGTERAAERLFVKFAGAPTKRAGVTQTVAIQNLRATAPVYQTLKHPNMVELIEAREIGGGYAMVFRWTDAECMGRAYPQAHARFLSMPTADRLCAFSDIQAFFQHVAEKGYVAIDFYDGSIMYDPLTKTTIICDVDYYRRKPAVNDMGRMWGSSRFQSPEEFQLGAPLDEVTNVYTLGATAFALFGEYQRDRTHWQLTETLYRVTTQAVSAERAQRYQSIGAFRKAWEAATKGAV